MIRRRAGKRARRLLPLLAAAALPASADPGLTLATGFDHSRGKYGGSAPTEITYIPFSARYETAPWQFRLTVPWLSISGPGTVIGGPDGRTVVAAAGAPRRTASGLGDVVASAGYTMIERTADGLLVDLIGKIKFGTADADDGLGTGENDYAVQADVVKSMGSVATLGTLGYRFMGDAPGLRLRNVWYGSVGAAYKHSPATTSGLLLDYRQAAVDGGKRQLELTGYAAYKLGDATRLQGYVVRGLADGSPDWGLGASLGRQF